MCWDVLQVCRDAGVLSNFSAITKGHNICRIRMVVLASVGALMDDMVQEDATPGVKATQHRYTSEKCFAQSHWILIIRHVVVETPIQSMGLASPCLDPLPP